MAPKGTVVIVADSFLVRQDFLIKKKIFWSRKIKLVNAFLCSAQKVKFAFAIVKAMRRKDLGIIKTKEICSVIISTEIKEIFT